MMDNMANNPIKQKETNKMMDVHPGTGDAVHFTINAYIIIIKTSAIIKIVKETLNSNAKLVYAMIESMPNCNLYLVLFSFPTLYLNCVE
jgi:hypothetical protein